MDDDRVVDAIHNLTSIMQVFMSTVQIRGGINPPTFPLPGEAAAVTPPVSSQAQGSADASGPPQATTLFSLPTTSPLQTGGAHESLARPLTANELAKPLPKAMVAKVRKAHSKYVGKVKNHLRVQGRFKKLQEDIAYMSQGRLQYPAGTRPFKSDIARAELDEPWSKCTTADATWSVNIPKGTSRRDAMTYVHHACQKALKQVDMEAQAHAELLTRGSVTQKAFMDEVEKIYREAHSAKTLDIDGQPPAQQANPKYLELFAKRLHAEGVDKMQRDHDKVSKAQQDIIKQKEEAKKKIAEASPALLLSQLVDAKVREAIGDIDDVVPPAEGEVQNLANKLASSLQSKGKGKKGHANPDGENKKPRGKKTQGKQTQDSSKKEQPSGKGKNQKDQEASTPKGQKNQKGKGKPSKGETSGGKGKGKRRGSGASTTR